MLKMLMFLLVTLLGINCTSILISGIFVMTNSLFNYWMWDELFLSSFSFNLILFSYWLMILILMFIKMLKMNNEFWMMVFFILFFSISFFFMKKVMLFYIFFELSILPIYLLILGWGYQFERLKAGLTMLVYMLLFSLPFLIIMIYLKPLGFYSIQLIILLFSKVFKFTFFFKFNNFLVLMFIVKLPMFFFHLWLPEAHVESPMVGSLILAGIMLKMGGYGLLVILNSTMVTLNLTMKFLAFSVWGSVLSGLLCCSLSDMKKIIAYSSVGHMSILVFNLMVNSMLSDFSSFLVFISHGFISSMLFFLMDYIYSTTESRSLFMNKSLIIVGYQVSFFWCFSLVFNMGGPLSLNLFSELMLLMNILMYFLVSVFIFFFILLINVYFSINLMNYSNQGIYFFMNLKYFYYSNLVVVTLLFSVSSLISIFFIYIFI